MLTFIPKQPVYPAEGEMQAHFIDVGQGDCIYIAAGQQNMLIDCGEADESARAVSYLQNIGVRRLDYVIGTHPHSDHMGGMDNIIDSFEVGEFIIPHLDDEDIPVTSYFLRFLDAVEEHGVKLTEAVTGSEFSVGDVHCEIVAPNSKKYEDINNYSVGLVLRHGSESFIFTGDAEGVAEQEMLDGGRLGKMSVYKVGHHGSSSSSTSAFLSVIRPEAAVISCGAGNPYGHPTDAVIKRLSAYTDNIYRTDLCGNIVITSDGSDLRVRTERSSR
ncbi:MAG: MBL fold metallo-hydrolase [Ruminococcus sp.]|nr:MBL fold metallo-hydrolase [Ruminococcus sp.]